MPHSLDLPSPIVRFSRRRSTGSNLPDCKVVKRRVSFDRDTISTLPSKTKPLKAKHQTKMQHVSSLPSMAKLLPSPESSASITKKKVSRMRHSSSAPSLADLSSRPDIKISYAAGATATTFTKGHSEDPTSRFAGTNPNEYFQHIAETAGLTYKTYSSLSLDGFFLETTPEHIAAYQSDLISAVRDDDIVALRQLHESGRNLQACNKFGESIVHMACRRGSTEIVRFLMNDAGLAVRLRDDYGRTPLHDALWTQKPEFECVEMILRQCPDLLLVTDKRGFTPLSYVRRDHWVSWCEFLESHKDMVLPNELL